jgi:hypothetical protein
MTRKHFEAVAKTLRANEASEGLCWDMAQEFKQFNNLFDVKRFMKAASITYDLSN